MRINVRDLMSSGISAQQAFEQAFQLCRTHPVLVPNLGLLGASGVVYVPAGVYELTASLEIPHHVHLEGEGQTSVLAFENGGLEMPRQVSEPDADGDVYSTLFFGSNRIRDLAIINTNPNNYHAGFDMLGGAGVQIERVYSQGWRAHYLLDQAALISIDQCYLGGVHFEDQPEEHENGIVFQNPPRLPITKGGSANVNSVSRCFFNLGGNPIMFSGDVMFVVDRCYINSGGPLIIGGRRASILHCTFENIRGDECIRVDAPGGTGAIGLEVAGCWFAKDVAAIRFNTQVVLGFTFNGNVANTNNEKADDVITRHRHVIENLPNQLQGPLIILGNSCFGDAPMVANEGHSQEVMLYASSAYSAGEGHRDRIGIGTIQPQALLDILGADQTAAPSPHYGFQVRSELGPLLRLRMVFPPMPPEQ